MKETRRSRFAAMLRRLIDETDVLRRAEWAEVLGVSEAAISQWVNDVGLPRPENVRAILTTLLADRRVSDETIEAFENLARRPGTEISPHGDRLSPNLAHYMLKPLRDGFLRTLETLPPRSQEKVLLEALERCRELRRVPPPVSSVAERRRASFEELVDNAIHPDTDHGAAAKSSGL
jgi:hypothetical protein